MTTWINMYSVSAIDERSVGQTSNSNNNETLTGPLNSDIYFWKILFMSGCRTEHTLNSVIILVERSLYSWLLTLAHHKVKLLFKLSMGLKLLLLLLSMGIAYWLYGISSVPIQSNKTIKLSNCLSLTVIMYCGYCLCSLKHT